MLPQIGSNLYTLVQNGGAAASKTERDQGSSNNTSAPGSAEDLSLSDQATWLQSLESEIRAQPAVDMQRVEEVRAAINSGEYSINSEVIADKWMRLDREVFGE